jgi:ATP-dependent helicase/nuclease subunit A
MSFTPAQQEAIAERGNVLVVAGAGTGKTSTLVERCLGCLLDPQTPASLDEILMVTFTEAAAAEMRHRIRVRLEAQLASRADDLRWSEQLALFETAHIGTLHSFCLQLVRQHFYELELDPQLTVLAGEEAKLLAGETLEIIFQNHYAGKTANAAAVQQLIQTHARGWDLPIRMLVLRLHHYTQTLRDPAGWFASQLAMYQSDEPAQWREWLGEGVRDWRERWLPVLRSVNPGNMRAAECAAIVENLPPDAARKQYAAALEQIHLADANWPPGKIAAWRKPLEGFFAEAAFLRSVAREDGPAAPLAQDWQWVRGQMTTLLELAREFTAAFSDAKRESGAVDFHDLEQHALRLLWDRDTQQPTPTAREWRRKLRFVFVDEYQDINDAQDAILQALSREGGAANRFLVGDVKQSIYRFRLADPRIFQGYMAAWLGEELGPIPTSSAWSGGTGGGCPGTAVPERGEGRTIPLVENFRSREAILDFVNSLFGALMRREIGGVTYDDDARLRFGDPENRAALGVKQNSTPCVELHLRLKSAGENGAAGGEAESTAARNEVMNLEEAAKEARLTALRLRELKTRAHPVWDDETRMMRPVQWGDMAVLLRSPAGKAESYAREFRRLGVPLTVARGGFYESLEITDLLSLLQLLDNPLQDLPALAVLRSPLVGMSLDELAAIRLMAPKVHCWTALQRFHELSAAHPGWPKADRFLKNFAAWRRLARQVSLSGCLDAVLGETHYAAWLLTQPRGEQRRANVQRLLALARQFDHFQRQGLFRFLRFIEAQQDAAAEPQSAPVAGDDSVALMSIHQSKGLEFPVVVAADLGKPFNLSDLRADIILDAQYGLCPQIKPPHTGRRYPSLPYWLARRRQKQELLGEELRLLYVAMTRARDLLLLTGAVAEKKFDRHLHETTSLATASLLAMRSSVDWIAAWLGGGADMSGSSGANALLRRTFYDPLDERLLDEPSLALPGPENPDPATTLDAKAWQELRGRLEWQYPHAGATRELAKASVSALRRRLVQEREDEAAPFFKFQIANFKSQIQHPRPPGELSATEIGTAHHKFMQLVSLEIVGSLGGLPEEVKRLEREGALTAAEARHLDLGALAAFWQSDLGTQIRSHARNVRRELEFTARFSPDELPAHVSGAGGLLDGEFVVVQGAADLAVLLPGEIWLVDFKTDRLTEAELEDRVNEYAPQVQLYAQALGRIYRRPVTRMFLHFLALKKSVAVEG